MAEIDHLVIGCRDLAQGAAWLEATLGAVPVPGGAHPGVGTHNALLGLGEVYLELIAPDPAQPEPAHPRPFDLDDPAMRIALEAEPRLIAYVARTVALDVLARRLGPRLGEIRPMSRGKLAWRLTFPPQKQDMGNLIPPMIEWQGETAAMQLPDSGLRLLGLEAEHPDQAALAAALEERGLVEAVARRASPHGRLVARIARADGRIVALSSD